MNLWLNFFEIIDTYQGVALQKGERIIVGIGPCHAGYETDKDYIIFVKPNNNPNDDAPLKYAAYCESRYTSFPADDVDMLRTFSKRY